MHPFLCHDKLGFIAQKYSVRLHKHKLRKNKEVIMSDHKLSKNIDKNIAAIKSHIKDCDDIKERTMCLAKGKVRGCIFYVEVAMNNLSIKESIIGRLIWELMDKTPDEIYQYLNDNALGITDVKELPTLEEAIMGIMIGDGVIFIDGYDKAIKIKSKGYPMMSLTESRTENVIRGSREGFADALKTNTALMRKRLRTSKMKVKEKIIGKYSNTTVAIVYIEGLARQSVIKNINKRLDELKVDELTDTGIIEQLTEENTVTPFPQYQTTERPDKAVEEIIKGRVVLFVDNTPIALIMPTNFSNFFQTADDYYNKPLVVSFARILRYAAAFIALTLPAIYLALANYHSEILPFSLLMSMVKAREGVPFMALLEVVFMELAFELLREAGIRIPNYAGSTISIVGGLIVGQAAVEAGLVSPIIVVVVALTALASYAVPNEEMSSAIRISKYLMIFLAAIMGLYGVALGIMFIIFHLCTLKSFDFPYMYPFTGGDLNGDADLDDTFIRKPLGKYKTKNFYTKRK